jgi:hypothetical protein
VLRIGNQVVGVENRGFGKVRLPAGDTVSRTLKRGDPVSEQENKIPTAVEIEQELREDFRKIMSRPTKRIKEKVKDGQLTAWVSRSKKS